ADRVAGREIRLRRLYSRTPSLDMALLEGDQGVVAPVHDREEPATSVHGVAPAVLVPGHLGCQVLRHLATQINRKRVGPDNDLPRSSEPVRTASRSRLIQHVRPTPSLLPTRTRCRCRHGRTCEFPLSSRLKAATNSRT